MQRSEYIAMYTATTCHVKSRCGRTVGASSVNDNLPDLDMQAYIELFIVVVCSSKFLVCPNKASSNDEEDRCNNNNKLCQRAS